MAIQSKTATFTGAEDYVDLTWTDTYTTYALLSSAPQTAGAIPGIKFTSVTGSGLRVEPSARFTGTVDVTIIEVLP